MADTVYQKTRVTNQTTPPPPPAPKKETKETWLNNYYNIGRFNDPNRIGYVMKLIRTLAPLTEDEWRIWYYQHMHDEKYLQCLAGEMFRTIPPEEGFTYQDCLDYIEDVMFRRTFLGYNKEKAALNILREKISPTIEESPAEWDSQYFIDFYTKDAQGNYIGIQLKPESFYIGQYQNKVDIDGKMMAFRDKFNAHTFILRYKMDPNKNIEFVNPAVITEIKELIKGKPKRVREETIPVNIRNIHKEIEMRRVDNQHASFPFIVQRKTGEKDLVWFYYSVAGPDRDNLFTKISSVYVLSPDGRLRNMDMTINVPFNYVPGQKLNYSEYIGELEKLYKRFSVNKMNSLLWSKAYKPLYDSYQEVKSRIFNMYSQGSDQKGPSF